MPEMPYGDWVTAVLTVGYLQLLAWKSKWGWPLGIATQAVWIWLSLSKELYGLTALSVVMTIQFFFAWRSWSRSK